MLQHARTAPATMLARLAMRTIISSYSSPHGILSVPDQRNDALTKKKIIADCQHSYHFSSPFWRKNRNQDRTH